ncbi:MAG: GNAT family N-acetyltransferase [Clostridiales bacterium]|nr:GNAT family N-acetyltransferase [Clostridiales bacterium]
MIIYKLGKKFNKDQITQLFVSVNWDSAKYPDKLYNGIISSETIISAWHSDNLVGLMTAISDTEMNVFFPYLLVHPSHQKRGIGGMIVKYMLEQYEGIIRKILICSNKNVAFYEKYGFVKKNEEQPMMIIY